MKTEEINQYIEEKVPHLKGFPKFDRDEQICSELPVTGEINTKAEQLIVELRRYANLLYAQALDIEEQYDNAMLQNALVELLEQGQMQKLREALEIHKGK